jgi:2-succinyl-5-enolpyruvyl-6-hydroxy-3-cyclohexene-1-carboxylate synthase
VAEPRSPAWRPAPTAVAHLDAVLRSPRAARDLRPEVVVRLGPPGSSRVVNEWLDAAGAVEVVAGAPGWSDPGGTAALVAPDAAAVVAALAASAPAAAPPTGWLAAWRAAGDAAAAVVAGTLDGGAASEPAVARAVAAALPNGARLVVSSSMPVRDVERYAGPRTGLAVAANRGANGIDGVVSTALGVALGSGAPTALLIGDLAFLHDSNGLLGAAGRAADLTIVVVDNDGGGIFSFLPQARALPGERFETLFGTPHGLDLVALAAGYGVDARRLDPGEDVGGALGEAVAKGGLRVLVVATDRAANVEAHRRVDEAVAAAVEAAL